MSTWERGSRGRGKYLPERAAPVLLCDGCRMSSNDIATVRLERAAEVVHFRELCDRCRCAALAFVEPHAACTSCREDVPVAELRGGVCVECVEGSYCAGCGCRLDIPDDGEDVEHFCEFCREVLEYDALSIEDASVEGLDDELWVDDRGSARSCPQCGRQFGDRDESAASTPLGTSVGWGSPCAECLAS